jgi:two-component system, OmpR family, response regulator
MARILVIDDSPTVVLSLSHLLMEDGHVVETVKEMTELSHYLRARRPDLILLDLEMPGLSGIEWARFMRRCHEGKLAVVIHSSQSWRKLEDAAREVDAVGIVPKGASADATRLIINSALRRVLRALG